MSQTKFEIGGSVESVCRKCKGVTDHYIVAVDGDAISKVECKVCKGRHAYKSPAEAKAPKAPRAAKSATEKGSASKTGTPRSTRKQNPSVQEQWEKEIAASGTPVAYSMEGVFRENMVIDHPAFGQGVVHKFVRAGKKGSIEVLFRDEVRILRCACPEPGHA